MSLPRTEIRHVLVTGCSSGIGYATARMLREHGWSVHPTVRHDEDLERLRAEGFEPLILHVDDAESVEKAVDELKTRTGGALGALVNNAGYGHLGPLEDLDRDGLRHQLEVNVVAVHHLTQLCLPMMIRQGSGRIVNIGSILGLVAIPFCGAYSASKFALEALTDALRAELVGTGIGVSLIGPGPIVSSFRDNAAKIAQASDVQSGSRFSAMITARLNRLRKKGAHSSRSLPPEAVARKILHALESRRPRGRYTVTCSAHLIELALRVLPRSAIRWIMDRKVSRDLRAQDRNHDQT